MSQDFLMTGARATRAAKKEKAQRRSGEAYRFWLGSDTGKNTAQITFLDGMLNDKGLLVPPSAWEHLVKLGGNMQTFICLKSIDEDAVCPICLLGNKQRPYLARYFTIIDHRKWKDREGKTHRNQKRLLVARQQTMSLFQSLAKAANGRLKFCTFKVTRNSNKEPNVGGVFELQKAWPSAKAFSKAAKIELPNLKPLDYKKALDFKTKEELEAIFGSSFGEGSTITDTEEADDDFDL